MRHAILYDDEQSLSSPFGGGIGAAMPSSFPQRVRPMLSLIDKSHSRTVGVASEPLLRGE